MDHHPPWQYFVAIVGVLALVGVTIGAAWEEDAKSDGRPSVGDPPFSVQLGPNVVDCVCTEHAILVCASRWDPDGILQLEDHKAIIGGALTVDVLGCRR